MKKFVFQFIFCALPIFGFGQLQESHLIDSIFSEWNKPETPGCALGIFKDGQMIYSKGYGMANLEYNIPNSNSTVFRIASVSKQFTAACVILLTEKGKLNLNDNLISFFPDFPEYAKNITIRHLINHTSGLRDYLGLASLKGLEDKDFYDDVVMRLLVNQTELNFEPGDQYLYCNSGYWLLGQIVNKVSEMNMADFAKKEIFEPLGMNNTHFHNDLTRIVKNRASGYAPNNDKTFRISMTTMDVIGDGGIFTTIKDIKKWDDAFYNHSVLSKSFWEKMTQQGVLNNGKVINYASGLSISDYKGLKMIRHGGSFVGYRAEFMRFPDENLSIAIFANRSDADPRSRANKIADLLLRDKLSESAKEDIQSEISFELQQLVGDYEIQPGVIFTISVQNDSLKVLQKWDKYSYNLLSLNGSTYQIPHEANSRISFSNLRNGVTQTVTILRNGREMKARRKKGIDEINVNLIDYVGSYYSKELDVSYNFKISDGGLFVYIENKVSKLNQCIISDIDQFTVSSNLIRFQRDNGKISGFEIDSGRLKNLKFKKK